MAHGTWVTHSIGVIFRVGWNETLIFARWVYHGWLDQGGLAILCHHLVSKVISTGKNKEITFWITGHLWSFSQQWTRGMNFQSKRGSRNRGTSRPKEWRDNSSRILTEQPINTSRWSGSSNISTYCLLCYFIRTISDIWKKLPVFIFSARKYQIQLVGLSLCFMWNLLKKSLCYFEVFNTWC